LLNRRHARHGTLDYRVGAGVGLFAGYAVVVRQKQDTGEWVESSGDWKPVGFSASLNHRLVYTRPKGVLSLALGETFSTGRVRAEVMDGTLTVPNMKRHSVSLTLGVRLGKRLRRN